MSLRRRVALAAMVAAGVVVLLVGIALHAAVGRAQLDAVDTRLSELAEAITEPAMVDALLEGADGGQSLDERTGFVLTDPDGEVLAGAGATLGTAGVIASTEYTTIEFGDVRWRFLTRPVSHNRVASVQVATSLAEPDEALTRLRRSMVILWLIALGAAGLGGWLLAGPALRPLERLRSTAVEIGTDVSGGGAAITRRIDQPGRAAEVADLTAALNDMLARIDAALAGERAATETARGFAANVAHELRTPLAALATNLDVLARPDLDPDTVAAILGDATAASRRIDDVLSALEALAQGELSDAAQHPVDLAEVIDAAVAEARRRHPHVTIGLTGPDSATVTGWPDGLRLAVDNLLANAALHGTDPATGAADIAVAIAVEGEQVIITVADRGPGIPLAERQRVLERFVRGSDAQRTGSGLGLALVTQQVRLHQGTIAIGDHDGVGCVVTITLPRPQPTHR